MRLGNRGRGRVGGRWQGEPLDHLQTRKFDGQKINAGYGLGIFNINEFLGHDGAIFGYSSVILTRPQTDTQLAFIANESTNSTTPTLTVALSVIKELYPDQLR